MAGNGIAIQNFSMPMNGSIGQAVFLGFCAAMLGISGFESSANYVEQQAHGVFPKTLKNMWLAVTIINPLIAICIICIIPMVEVGPHKESLLSYLGSKAGGPWLSTLISIDAVLVLSGAVLTSFVGVGGLIKRMTLDRVLPQFLLHETKRGGTPFILLFFYLLCISVLLVTQGKLVPLAGVYTISFLLVMAYFAYGNFLLKLKRTRLPRPETASPLIVSIGFMAVMIALYGNVKLYPQTLIIFLQYFIPSILVIFLMLNRNTILQYLIVITTSVFENIKRLSLFGSRKMKTILHDLTNQEYFTKGDGVANLNKVMIYVSENEITNKLKIVNVANPESSVPSENFLRDFEVLNRAYPAIDIEFLTVEGVFGPEIIKKLSDEWNIPVNYMFISSPGDRFSHKVADLGGVRLIM
jgi:amino acid transporter